jgi:hypothetical protein
MTNKEERNEIKNALNDLLRIGCDVVEIGPLLGSGGDQSGPFRSYQR